MNKLYSFACLVVGLTSAVQAVIPEPDNVVYGMISLGTNPPTQITAANTDVTVQARRALGGPVLATYTMGSRPSLGNYYALRIGAESVLPITRTDSFQSGDTVDLTVSDATGVRAQQTVTMGPRGQITRVDIGTSNTLPALSHPADNAPADGTITATELNAYSSAWQMGATWPVNPNPIPIAYVARAGFIVAHGGNYTFDSAQVASAPTNSAAWWATNAPLWWVSTATANQVSTGSTVARDVPASYTGGAPLTVNVAVTCSPGVGAYAVEDQTPAGWQVSAISDGGMFDAVNNKVKWGVFMDATSRTLSYTVTPPSGASGDVQFAAQSSFDGQLVPVTGNNVSGLAARFSALAVLPGGAFRLSLKGSPGESQDVLVSTNLTQWAPFATAVFDKSGSWQFTDTDAIGSSHRFYRMGAGQ